MSDEEALGALAEEQEFDDYYDDLGDPEHLPADHPLMRPMQDALFKQLSEDHERVELQLRVKEEALKKLRRGREDVGVQLYGVQQQLAKMQMSFERAHDNFNIIERYRKEAEEQRDMLEEEFRRKKQEVDQQGKKVVKAQDELNQLIRTLRQVEDYNQQMKSDIAGTRRTTYRAEEALVNLEKDKRHQDLFIDSINEEIKRLNEQKNLLQAQLISQQEETAAAEQTLKEAEAEMAKIDNDKKVAKNKLTELWQHIKQREEMLETVRLATQKQQEKEVLVDSELEGYKTSIKKELERTEDLSGQLEKISAELSRLAEINKSHQNADKRLVEQHNLLTSSLQATQDEMARLETERKQLLHAVGNTENAIMRIHQDTKKRMQDIFNHLSEQTTFEKRASNMVKQAKRISGEVNDKEVELEQVKNEISRVKIDIANTNQWNETLQQKKAEIYGDLEEKEGLLKNFEYSIGEKHKELGKKQLQLDKLNKEYADYTKNVVDTSAGPQEAQINSLTREIGMLEGEIAKLEKEWIISQTRLVTEQEKIGKIEGNCDQVRTKVTVLEQRKVRLNGEIAIVDRDIVSLGSSLKNLGNDMHKLNLLLAKNREFFERLEGEKRNLERDFVGKLKALEGESVELEQDIDDSKQEKANVLEEIIEAERQILLWERKIQLEKEMQQTIDPDIGQSEMKAMKKEIHRMELKYERLKQKQKLLIKDMEQAVFKREAIQIKYQPKAEMKSSKTGSASTSKQIGNLKNMIRQSTVNSEQLDAPLERRKDELERLEDDMKAEGSHAQELEEELARASVEVVADRLSKHANLWLITKNQTLAKRYGEISANKFKLSMREDSLRSAFEETVSRNRQINEVLTKVRAECPQYSALLDKVVDWD
jgi:chromosome segregation ATPase